MTRLKEDGSPMKTMTEAQSKRIIANVKWVFDTGDSWELSAGAYQFIISHMGHIAHYDREGFASNYEDLRLLTRSLQTSEYSSVPHYTLHWANVLDQRYRKDPVHGCGATPVETATIRGLVEVARACTKDVEQRERDKERERALVEARAIVARYGITSVELGGSTG